MLTIREKMSRKKLERAAAHGMTTWPGCGNSLRRRRRHSKAVQKSLQEDRSGSSPVLARRNQPPIRVTDSFWCARGDLTWPAGQAGSRGKRAPGTFSNTAPVRFPIRCQKKRHPQRGVFSFGGDGGNRTPVRKRFLRNFSGRRRLFAFPRPCASRHARGLGSFMMHGTLKALRTHGPHSSTPHNRAVGLPEETLAH